MLDRFLKALYLTRGEKSVALAYAAVIAMSAGISVLIMTGIEGPAALGAERSLYVFWVIFSGAIGGGVALLAARGWMGNAGVLGFARAFVGAIAVAFLASLIAGTMIFPLYGTFYAPVILLTEVIAKPWLGIAWFAILIGAHYMMTAITEERALGYSRAASHRPATSRLSTLSRAQLYHRK
ncbi:hypothetical protein [Loktanella sp. Alg231-35]|uniref:hypothetical protein n=1 Tax=Loktanella sp. Alg231-35 TaxID=1922220 RepID=UPI000D55847E|nr:hypothetical protein [Loktanella sp. Alg231-35]